MNISQLQSPETTGSPPSGGPVLVAGQDGTNVRTVLTDSTGKPVVVGAGTAGTPAGGVVSVQGVVGGTAQPVSVASLPLPAGAATAALQTQPGVDIGDVTVNNGAGAGAVNVQDGGNSLTVDATSWPLPTGASTLAEQQVQTTRLNLLATEASLAAQSQVDNTAFTDGTSRVVPAGFILDETLGTALTENDAGAARMDSKRAQVMVLEDATTRGLRQAVSYLGGARAENGCYPSFTAVAEAVVLANQKSLLSLANTHASKLVRIWRVYLMNAQTAAVTGVVAQFQLRRFATHSAGTVVTPVLLDTSETLDAAITARSNGTLVSLAASALVSRRWSTDEWGPGTLDVEAAQIVQQNTMPFWEPMGALRPITLRQNEGLSVHCNTNTTAGSCDVEIHFTVEG